ncbi:hypothetical protein NQ314_018810 [Rhamnusium bicolor]|uniref:Uncharacterized protein n=1 Tax=Rhamnusium bicolor TaxID=1586634 RepID=A0AAV8WQ54_9CUCU|nr:hypothetical protein NQ314_018810 [Rhamnusium bicolor]
MSPNEIMTTYRPIYVFYILSISIFLVWSAVPPSLRYPLPVVLNKITNVNLTCDSENLNITLTLQSPFKGVLFAKDFAQECKSVGKKFYIIVLYNLEVLGLLGSVADYDFVGSQAQPDLKAYYWSY